MSINDTQFDCKICGTKVVFRIDDLDKFNVVKDEEKVFAGLTLGTFRVPHKAENKMHINVVTVDDKGFWRGLKDSYEEELAKENFTPLFENLKIIKNSSIFELLFIIDVQDFWYFNLIESTGYDTSEFAFYLNENLKEMFMTNAGVFTHLDVELFDKSVDCWVLGNHVIASVITQRQHFEIIDSIFSNILSLENFNSPVNINPNSFLMGIKAIDKIITKKFSMNKLLRIFKSEEFNSPYDPKADINKIMEYLISKRKYSEYLILGLFTIISGQNTIAELLNQGYLEDFEPLLEMIDLIETTNF